MKRFLIGLAIACAPFLATAGTPDMSSCDVWKAACHYASSNREATYDINRVVIHKTQGATAAAAASWFANCSSGGSAHYTLDKANGYCYQSVREYNVAWHAGYGSTNNVSIGIEHSGWVANNDTSTACYDESAAITRSAIAYYGVPCSRSYIIGHSEVPGCANPGGGGVSCHTDPGAFWNWGYYMAKCSPAPPPPAEKSFNQVQAAGDFNGDGRTDIAWRKTGWGNSILDFGGGGSAALPAGGDGHSDFNPYGGDQLVLTGDFDGDGKSDFAYRKKGWTNWFVDFGNGAYGNSLSDGRTDFDPANNGVCALVGDINGDGRSDIAWRKKGWGNWMVNCGSAGSTGFPGNGDGRTDFDPSSGNQTAVAGDFDGDGKCDLAFRKTGWANWFVDFGSGAYGNSLSDGRTDFDPAGRKLCALVGDMNGDGKSDVAWRKQGWGNWIVNHGSGGSAAYPPSSDGHGDFDPVSGSQLAVAGDFDGDGRCDLAFRKTGWGNWFVDFGSGAYGSSLGDGRTDFDPRNINTVAFCGKFDSDSKWDVVWRKTGWTEWIADFGNGTSNQHYMADGRSDFNPSLQ